MQIKYSAKTSWLSPEQYALRYGLKADTVRKRCRNGTLAARKEGKLWRIPLR